MINLAPHFITEKFVHDVKSNKTILLVSILGSIFLYFFAVCVFCFYFKLSVIYFFDTIFYPTFLMFMFLLSLLFFILVQLSLNHVEEFNKKLEIESPDTMKKIRFDKECGIVGSVSIPLSVGFRKPFLKNSGLSILMFIIFYFILESEFSMFSKIIFITLGVLICSILFWLCKQYVSSFNAFYGGILLLGYIAYFYDENAVIKLSILGICLAIIISFMLANVASIYLVVNALSVDKQIGVTLLVAFGALLCMAKYILDVCLFLLGLTYMGNGEVKEINTNISRFNGVILLVTEKKIFCRKPEDGNLYSFSGHDHYVDFSEKKSKHLLHLY